MSAIDDAVRQAQQNPVVEIIIQYVPNTGQLALRASNVDDVMKLGMLETAKSLIIEERVKKQGSSVLGVPTGVKLS
jgi:hypothetical protein